MKSKLINAITIDPGANTGYAYWLNGQLADFDIFKKSEDCETEVEAVNDQAEKFKHLIDYLEPKEVWIEGVSMWSASSKSVISTAKGNLFTLAYMVGAYIEICRRKKIKCHIIYPRDWKGNMSKEITKRRVMRSIGDVTKNEHILDAIGIGLSLKKEL